MSGNGNKLSDRGALTLWRAQEERLVRTPTQSGTPRALTSWRVQRDRRLWTRKQTDRQRSTYFLENPEGGTSQDTETTPASEGHSLPGLHRGRDKSGHGNNLSERGALTSWRAHMDGQVRTWKQPKRAS